MTIEKRLSGHQIILRDVEIDDAEFILSLRTDEKKSRFLNKTSDDLKAQQDYIQAYKKKEKEFYFIIQAFDGTRLGTVRIYDVTDESFCWGSWLMIDDAPKLAALETAILVYDFGFHVLGFKKSHFDVRKENKSVIGFHKAFGAKIVEENDLDCFFKYRIEDYEAARVKFSRFITL